MNYKSLHIIGISGSLRSNSANTNILRAIMYLLPDTIQMTLYERLDTIPHFNPEIEKDGTPLAVQELRSEIQNADAVIFCTPEYAFGVPGVLKNALDWLVSSGELNEKPVAAISASPLTSGGDKALASLMLTLTALGTKISEPLSLSIPAVKKVMTDDGDITDNKLISQLRTLTERLIEII
jgi:chromate reductase